MRDSLDGEEFDAETGGATPDSVSKDTNSGTGNGLNAGAASSSSAPPPPYARNQGATSPLPAPVPQKHSSLATAGAPRQGGVRDSLDGETIFAVGGDDEEGEAFLDRNDTHDGVKKNTDAEASPIDGETPRLHGNGKKS